MPAPVSLSLSICKHGLDPDQTRMVFRIECFINFKMCACDRKYKSGMSDFVVQKSMRTISLGFGSSKEEVVTRPKHTVFRYSKKPSQNKRSLCKHRAVSLSLSPSLSLSLSLLLRPAIKVCKQFRSKRSSDVPDQGQTSIPRVII